MVHTINTWCESRCTNLGGGTPYAFPQQLGVNHGVIEACLQAGHPCGRLPGLQQGKTPLLLQQNITKNTPTKNLMRAWCSWWGSCTTRAANPAPGTVYTQTPRCPRLCTCRAAPAGCTVAHYRSPNHTIAHLECVGRQCHYSGPLVLWVCVPYSL